MKSCLLVLILLVSAVAVFGAVPPARAESQSHVWALLLSCDVNGGNDTYYMYRTLIDRYHLPRNHINYVSVYYDQEPSHSPPDPDPSPPYIQDFNATIDDSGAVVRNAITNWLGTHSTSEDTIFIYSIGHGRGYDEQYTTIVGGRADQNLDEGNEVYEARVGHDLNGDHDAIDWVGIDEAMVLEKPNRTLDEGGEWSHPFFGYYDDDLAADLSSLDGKYKTLVFVKQGCYQGGLIDDLSGPNRIIITSTNETHTSSPPNHTYGFSDWSKTFIDALSGQDMKCIGWNLVPQGQVDADSNDDGFVSMKEAWQYAWNHDIERINRHETPWLDDNGNGLPTYKDDMVYGTVCDDGTLAGQTLLEESFEITTCDSYGVELPGSRVWINGTLRGYSPLTLLLPYGNYRVQVETFFVVNSLGYQFWKWEDGTTSSLRTVSVSSSLTSIIAYYNQSGGGGCPYAVVWNGTGWTLDNNLLPSSETNPGTDVDDYYRLEQGLVPYHVGRWVSEYCLKILEFEHEHSHLDQAMLMAVDHAPGTIVAVMPTGEILTFTQPSPPLSCVDNAGEDRLSQIALIDGNLSDPATFYHGVSGSCLTLDFGRVTSQNAKLLFRADWVCEKDCIQVQVVNNSQWQTVATLFPRDNWAFDALNVSQYVNAEQDFVVRLLWTSPHNLDCVGLDTTPQEPVDEHAAVLLLANHSTQGNVRSMLLSDDQLYAELSPGEQIQLMFVLPNKPQEKQRTFILLTNGYYETIQGV